MRDYSRIPPELTALDQWVCWGKKGYKTQKERKVPFNPTTRRGADSTDPTDLVAFSIALAAVEKGLYDGIGFATLAGDGYVMVDLDTVRDPETKFVAPEAKEVILGLSTYSEFSMSGYGFHAICKGEKDVQPLKWNKVPLPPNGIIRADPDTGELKEPEIEMYTESRYFAFTGEGAGPMDIPNKGLHLKIIQSQYEKAQSKQPVPMADRDPKYWGSYIINGTDYLARGLEKDDRFKKRWEGHRPLGNESRDDAALMLKLAYWTNCDEEKMVEAFLASPYVEQKDEAHLAKLDRDSYLVPTVQNAIRLCDSTAALSSAIYWQEKWESVTAALQDMGGALALEDYHPENNPRYEWTDLGNGNLFADCYKHVARYVPERKKWYVFDGKVWQPDTGDMTVAELCKRLAVGLIAHAAKIKDDNLRSKYVEFVGRWQGRHYRETVLKDAKSVHPVPFAQFDDNLMLFNCLNGTLDLETFEFHEHRPEDFLTKMSGVVYDPEARCERWERFMGEVLEENTAVIQYLQKSFGYALTGDVSEECFFLLYGPKTRNGKGTTMGTFYTMLGDYARVAMPATIGRKVNPNSSAPSEDVARLAGARFVNISEPDKGLVLDAAMVKTITGSDPISARVLNENTIEFVPQFKLFINSNHLPKVSDLTIFSSDRVRVFMFNRHFAQDERDTNLKQELSQPENLSGVFNWCLEGLKAKRAQGFDPPEDVLLATKEYQESSDKIGRFIKEALIVAPDDNVKYRDVWEHFKRWCNGGGQYSGAEKDFKKALKDVLEIVENQRPKSGGNPTTLVVGYKLNTDFDSMYDGVSTENA